MVSLWFLDILPSMNHDYSNRFMIGKNSMEDYVALTEGVNMLRNEDLPEVLPSLQWLPGDQRRLITDRYHK